MSNVLRLQTNKTQSDMGRVYAEIELIRTGDLSAVADGYLPPALVRRMKVTVLVDSGADMLAINAHIKTQLNLPVIQTRECSLADGSVALLEIVGPVDIRFENRETTVRAIVLPGEAEPLLGAIPMEDMDVIIIPYEKKMIPNPKNPNYSYTSLK
ncbi:MAG: clan AA aspartic protease [Phycisphaerae bacterium]|nr:clan AA aspartic protease [Saprospiraceae bacterium]